MAEMLEKELDTYEKNKETLVGSSEGKFVLIRGDKVGGVYDSKPDAINEGYRQFGNVPFLVKQILKVENRHNFVSNLLGC